MSAWWTEDRINAAVHQGYIVEKLGPKSHAALHRPLAFGDGLTDDTYLDWIISRGKRLFLILHDLGIPEWIFEAVDRSFDDDDLPLSEEAIWDLNLSHSKTDLYDKKFYRLQWIYLVQDLQDGTHVDYGPDEIVPVAPVIKRTGILANLEVDRVYVKELLCIRKRIPIGGDDGVDKIHFILHLKSLQKLSHPHTISVFATYTQNDYGYIILTPALDNSLKSFIDEPPKHFRVLSRPERRKILLQWIYCLSSAVAYLHSKGHAHQAIRPSNVFISWDNSIYLGESMAMEALEDKSYSYDKAAYDYEAPERWCRKPTLQETAPPRSTLHGGGRTVRRLPKDGSSRPVSSASTTPRSSMTTGPSSRTPATSTSTANLPPPTHFLPRPTTSKLLASTRAKSSTSSSSSARSSIGGPKRTLITTFTPYLPPSSAARSLSATTHLFPSDVFSLSCIHLEILTFLISSTSSSFSTASKFSAKNFVFYRGKRNRTAGRGGAPADSSFHANLTMVGRWIEKLEKEVGAGGAAGTEGKKGKVKKGDADRAREKERVVLLGLLDVARRGLRREASERWDGELGRGRVGMLVRDAERCKCKDWRDRVEEGAEGRGMVVGGDEEEEEEEEKGVVVRGLEQVEEGIGVLFGGDDGDDHGEWEVRDFDKRRETMERGDDWPLRNDGTFLMV